MRLVLSAVLIGASTTVLAIASKAHAQGLDFLAGIKVTSEYSVGALSGRAQEYVYNSDGSVLSRLNWDFSNVSMFNAKTSAKLLPWLTVGMKTSFNLNGDAKLQDIDIGVVGCPGGYCESNSGTRLRSAYMLDASIAAEIFKSSGVALNMIGGYKRDHYRWEAIGGTANYVALPPGLGISYQQTWSTPYVGVGVAVESGKWSVSGRVIGSAWAKGEDRDNHHLRSLLFIDTAEKTKFISGDLGIAYRFNPYFSLTADYRYQMWGLGKGPTTITDLTTGASATITGNASGQNNTSHAVALGFKVDLQPATDTAGLKDAPMARPAVWTGWYLGVAGGSQLQRDTWTTKDLAGGAPDAETAERDMFGKSRQRASLFAGYNALIGATLLGAEIDIGKSNASVTRIGIPGTDSAAFLGGSTDSVNVHSNVDASARLRLGYVINPATMVFGTAGLAIEHTTAGVSCNVGGPWCVLDRYEVASKWRAGWTAGLGFERNFAGHWFTRAEYRYTHLSAMNQTFFANAPADAISAKIDGANHRLNFGIGTRF